MGKQIADVEDMVSKGVNLLILNPRDPEGLVAAANAATDAGVKVVVMDSSINTKANVITQVRSSNDQNGYPGRPVARQEDAGQADQDHPALRLAGQRGRPRPSPRRLPAALLEGQLVNDGHAGFEVLGQGWGSWAQEEGLKAAEDLLQAHPDANVVLGENEFDGARRDQGARSAPARRTCSCSPPPTARRKRSP